MKKFKLIAASLVASSMLLAGCGKTVCEHYDKDLDHKCDTCGEKISDCVDKNKDHKCDACGAELSQHSDENKDHKCDLCGETVSQHVDENGDHVCDICEAPIPSVESVKIVTAETKVGIGDSLQLSANVKAFGGASNKVSWSVDNELIANIDENGVLTGTGFGKVTVTAESVDDATKKDSVDIQVIFGGSLADLGYEFSADFPENKVKEFLGEGSYSVFGPSYEVAKGGYWFLSQEAAGEYAGYASVIINLDLMHIDDDVNMRGELFFDELNNCEFLTYFYDMVNEMDCYMDSTAKYFIAVTNEMTDENYYMGISFYKTSELFTGGSELTGDEEWPSSYSEAMVGLFGEELPFGKFGVNYSVSIESGMLILMDQSTNISAGFNYEETLVANGYKYSEVEGVFYKQSSLDDNKAIAVETHFSVGYGNIVIASLTENIYSDFPEAKLDAYVANVLKSSVKIPAVEKESLPPVPPPPPPLASSRKLDPAKNYEFRFRVVDDEYDRFEHNDSYAEVSCLLLTKADFADYIDVLIKDGFVIEGLEYWNSREKDFAYVYNFVKDDLGVIVELNPETAITAAGSEVNWDRSTMTITAYSEAGVPSIFFVDGDGYQISKAEVRVEATQQLKLDAWRLGELKDLTFTYSSSDTDVATVDASGVVTGVKVGSAKITATTTYEGSDYSAELDLTVAYQASKESIVFKDEFSSIEAPIMTKGGTMLQFASATPTYDDSTGVVTLQAGDLMIVALNDGHTFSEIRFDGIDSIEDKFVVMVPDEGGYPVELDGTYIIENYFFDGPNDDYWGIWEQHSMFAFGALEEVSFSGLNVIKDDGVYMFGHGSFASVIEETDEYMSWYDAEKTVSPDGKTVTYKYDSWTAVSDTEGFEFEDWWSFLAYGPYYSLPMCFVCNYADYEFGTAVEVKYDSANERYYMEVFTEDKDVLCNITYEKVTVDDVDEYYYVITMTDNH